MQCVVGASLSNTECTIYALILPHSPSDIALLYKARAEGSHEHISECIEISIVQSVLEWLVYHNLSYRNITLDNRFIVPVFTIAS